MEDLLWSREVRWKKGGAGKSGETPREAAKYRESSREEDKQRETRRGEKVNKVNNVRQRELKQHGRKINKRAEEQDGGR